MQRRRHQLCGHILHDRTRSGEATRSSVGAKATARSVESCRGRFVRRCWRRLNIVEFHHGVRDAVRLQRRVGWPRTVSVEPGLKDSAEATHFIKRFKM